MAATKVRKQPTQGRARVTVEAIIEAAAELLAQSTGQPGNLDLSTNAIAARAGVSIGSVYQYFPNKQAIVAALVEHQLQKDHAQLRAGVDTLLASDPRPSLSQALEQMLQGMCQYQLALSPLLAKLLPLVPELERESLVFEAFEAMSVEFRRLVEAFPDELRPELGNADHLGETLFVLMHGIRGALNAAAQHDLGRLARPGFQSALVDLVQRTLLNPARSATSPRPGGAAGALPATP